MYVGLREIPKVMVRSFLITQFFLFSTSLRSLPDHHPCTDPCHAPSACSEDTSCQSHIELTCPCGRLKRAVFCARSAANPGGRAALVSQQIQCTNDCLIAKRNARLAEALGINPQGKQRAIVYSDDLMAFAKANVKFSSLVEKTFGELVVISPLTLCY
jgi:transcriptional repressor NF-X1